MTYYSSYIKTKSEPRMRLLLELMLVHVAYATSQPSLARVAAVRLCTPALRAALQPRSGSVPRSSEL